MKYDFDFEKVKNSVADLMKSAGGHGLKHALDVLENAMKIAAGEDGKGADKNIIALVALLHDVDDYKFFGNSENYGNARRIMADARIAPEVQARVTDGIKTIGFSKRLKGIVPEFLEAKIVSDADMMDGMNYEQALQRMEDYRQGGAVLFDAKVLPRLNVSAEEYGKRPTVPLVNHIMEKLLRLKDMMLTDAGRAAAEKQHIFLRGFLRGVFKSHNAAEWNEMLDKQLNLEK
ncbi:MAG: hypothetical protein LBT45_01510 [Rickettsiales bacterium]|jgi:uncharacterized protein|nr:hypothetical protein [Rickettsiales bacterium]